MLTFLWSLAQCKHSSSLRNARLVYLLLVLLNASSSSSLLNARLVPLLTCRHTMHGDTFLVCWANHARPYLASLLGKPCKTIPCLLVGWANHARLYLASLQPSKLSPVSCVVLFSTPRTCRAFQHATHCPVHTRLSCSGWSLGAACSG